MSVSSMYANVRLLQLNLKSCNCSEESSKCSPKTHVSEWVTTHSQFDASMFGRFLQLTHKFKCF